MSARFSSEVRRKRPIATGQAAASQTLAVSVSRYHRPHAAAKPRHGMRSILTVPYGTLHLQAEVRAGGQHHRAVPVFPQVSDLQRHLHFWGEKTATPGAMGNSQQWLLELSLHSKYFIPISPHPQGHKDKKLSFQNYQLGTPMII